MLDPFSEYRYVLASNETGNIIDGSNDRGLMMMYLKRFRRTNMSVFDTDTLDEYWYDENRKLCQGKVVVTPDCGG